MSPDGAGPRPELGSRSDVAFEHLLDELRQSLASLAISVRTCRRGSDNPVFRMSAEQQFATGLSQLAALMSLPSVPYDDDAARRLTTEAEPFIAISAQLTWTNAGARITELFARRVAELYAADVLRHEGRPVAPLEALLAARAPIPEPVRAEPGAPAPEETAVAVAPADEPILLHETVFNYGDGSHQHLIGAMYLAFAMHVRGMNDADARKSLSPAALIGFAQSLEKALGSHRGHVAFRIVRKGGVTEPQLHRMSTAVKPEGA